jgi:hypothetical protein
MAVLLVVLLQFIAILKLSLGLQGLKMCNETKNEEIQICKTSLSYVNNLPPEPLPTLLRPTIHINDVIDVDVTKKTMTVFCDLYLAWNDSYLSIGGAKNER